MEGFVDLKVPAQEDQSTHAILARIYFSLHLELVERKLDRVAVCFPKAKKSTVGDVLRVLGVNKDLTTLLEAPRLRCLSDYYNSTGVESCPEGHAWRHIKRVQPKLTAAKARRMVKRGSASEERAQALYDQGPAVLAFPYLNMNSASSGQKYRLYVNQVPCEPPSKAQSFNSFGLGACVPWF